MSEQKRLYRSQSNRVLGGVCGGIGEYLGIDPLLVRLGFVVLGLVNGIGFIIYLIMWLLVPDRTAAELSGDEVLNANIEDMKERVKGLGQSMSQGGSGAGLIGLILVALGGLFLVRNLTGIDIQIQIMFPALLILAGIYLLVTRR